jgi:type I site-specific restriction endonuclease
VADGVNVDFEVYKIRTRITAQGATIEAEDGTMVGYRHRQSRRVRWEAPDEDITYGADALDRAVVAKDQIRLIAQTFRDRLFTDLVATSLESGLEDFDNVPFAQEGGRGRAARVFGKELEPLLQELNEVLAA